MNLLVLIVIMLSNDATIDTSTGERTRAAAECVREQRALAAAAASHSFGLATEQAEVLNPRPARCSTLSRLRWQLTFPTRRVAVGCGTFPHLHRRCRSSPSASVRPNQPLDTASATGRTSLLRNGVSAAMHTTPPAPAIGTLVGTRPTTLQTSAPSPVETPTCPPPMAVACVCRC
mmetsp:Transcript_42421/g.105631  ORF Transcript_42421/g.105631 Transcript_42421/m.105631 type:complete len:175 (-) Transcript_42421:89-613(-)